MNYSLHSGRLHGMHFDLSIAIEAVRLEKIEITGDIRSYLVINVESSGINGREHQLEK